jgi:hypothetical protein
MYRIAHNVISKIINSIRPITKWSRVLREGKRKTDRGHLNGKLKRPVNFLADAQNFEELLSHTNVLNRKLEEVYGVGKEFTTVADLWGVSSFHLNVCGQLMSSNLMLWYVLSRYVFLEKEVGGTNDRIRQRAIQGWLGLEAPISVRVRISRDLPFGPWGKIHAERE